MQDVKTLGEQGLVSAFEQWLPKTQAPLGLGDDCAVLPWGKHYQLFATDMLTEGVHFKQEMSPQSVGWKALAVNISDIAAMGGLPRYAVISLGCPAKTPVNWVKALYRGLSRCAQAYDVEIVGGDTVRSSKIVINVALLGEVEKTRCILRSGAKPNDWLLVTGKLGGSFASGRHLKVQPRVDQARKITQQFKVHAMMDLSDGLYTDVQRMAEASNLSAQIEVSALPLHRGASVHQGLQEGEDFELLLSVSPDQGSKLLSWAQRTLDCGLAKVGKMVQRGTSSHVELLGEKGVQMKLRKGGFRHF